MLAVYEYPWKKKRLWKALLVFSMNDLLEVRVCVSNILKENKNKTGDEAVKRFGFNV